MAKMKQFIKEMTEKKIIESAKLLFLEVGYEKSTTSAIAKKAGIAEGTLYNYFSSKASMLFSIFEEYLFDETLTFVDDPYKYTDDALVKNILDIINHYWGSLSKLDKNLYRIQNIEILKAQYSNDPSIGRIVERYMMFANDIKKVMGKHSNVSDKRMEVLTNMILALAHFNMDKYALMEDLDAETIWLEMSNQMNELLL